MQLWKEKDCQLKRKCRTENKCIVPTSRHPGKAYLGNVEGDFKKRYNHISSFKNEVQMSNTLLRKYVWELTPTLKWNKVFKSGLNTFCGRQPLKNLKRYGLLKHY